MFQIFNKIGKQGSVRKTFCDKNIFSNNYVGMYYVQSLLLMRETRQCFYFALCRSAASFGGRRVFNNYVITNLIIAAGTFTL